MGVFDKGVSEDEFYSFKKEVLHTLSNLKDEFDTKASSLKKDIDKKASDSEVAALKAEKGSIDALDRIKSIESDVGNNLAELERLKKLAEDELKIVVEEKEKVLENTQEATTKTEEIKAVAGKMINIKEEVDSATSDIYQNIEKINTILTESASLPNEVANIESLLVTVQGHSTNIESLQSHSLKKKSEIDNLYNEIFGQDITDETKEGVTEHINGLKDDLADAYDSLDERITTLDSEINEVTSTITSEYEISLISNTDEFKTLIDDSKSEVKAVKEQLSSLLPGAMAEGLSAAYEKKKEDEIISQGKLESSFKRAISLLVVISLIPFCVDLYLLIWQKADLVQVIKDTPNLLLSIFPIYFPVLWFAYSSNKKMNLSKRLIEEYTHKSVLGKTFEGLSNQIESLPKKGGVKDELRTKLLYNLLQVSSENPGKLITDYNKSDHPLMEALENSSKLGNSVDSLSKIPGFSSLAKKFANKSDDILKQQSAKIETGLEAHEELSS